MFKRIMLAVALMASALIGVTAVSAVAPPTAGAVTTNGACNGDHLGIDWKWHLATRTGYSYHLVEDDFAAYTINGQCTYTIHANVDVCNGNGCFLSAFEAWIPYWGEIIAPLVKDYTFSIVSSTPTAGVNEGVWLYNRNSGTNAFCHISNSLCTYPSAYGGSEWEHGAGISFATNQHDGWGFRTNIYP